MPCIFIMYLGRVGTGEDVAWLEPQLNAAMRAEAARSGAGSMDARVSTIELKVIPSYSTQHRKTTTMSLERALQAAKVGAVACGTTTAQRRLRSWEPMVCHWQRLVNVCMQARQQFRED